jgi:hypothetical protein
MPKPLPVKKALATPCPGIAWHRLRLFKRDYRDAKEGHVTNNSRHLRDVIQPLVPAGHRRRVINLQHLERLSVDGRDCALDAWGYPYRNL